MRRSPSAARLWWLTTCALWACADEAPATNAPAPETDAPDAVADTDTDTDLGAVHTPQDTAPPAPKIPRSDRVPPDLGPGFVDITPPPALLGTHELGDNGLPPRWNPATFAQLDDDPTLELVVVTSADTLPAGAAEALRCRGQVLDWQPDAMVWQPFEPMPCLSTTWASDAVNTLAAGSVAAIDLNHDGIDELLTSLGGPLELFTATTAGWQRIEDPFVFTDPCNTPASAADSLGVGDLNDDGKRDLLTALVSPPGCPAEPLRAWVQTDDLRFEPTDWMQGPAGMRIHGVAYLYTEPTAEAAVCFAGSEVQRNDQPHCQRPVATDRGDVLFEPYAPFRWNLNGNHPMGAEVLLLDGQTCPTYSHTARDISVHDALHPVDRSTCATLEDAWFETTALHEADAPLMDPMWPFTPWGHDGTLDLDGDGCQDMMVNFGRDLDQYYGTQGASFNHTVAYFNRDCHVGMSRYMPWPRAAVGDLYGPLFPMSDHNGDGSVNSNDRFDFNLDGVVDDADTEHHSYEGGGLACADWDGDGDADCVLSGAYDTMPRVLRNDVTTPHGLLTVTLRSQTSTPLGARIDVLTPDSTQDEDAEDQITRCSYGAGVGPNAIGPESCTFGLAEHPSATVTVSWRSGFVQTIPDAAAGQRLSVVEPDLLTVAPAVFSNGQVSHTVTACPYLGDGITLDASATTTLTGTPYGPAGVWTAPEALGDGCIRRTHTAAAVAPDTPYADTPLTRVHASFTYTDGSVLDLAVQPTLLHRQPVAPDAVLVQALVDAVWDEGAP